MAKRLTLSPRSKREIGEAYEWYQEQVAGLGEEFLSALDSQLVLIKSSPGLYVEVLPGIRRALLGRFPYAVFYTQRAEVIAVLAVVHTSRSPRRWPRR